MQTQTLSDKIASLMQDQPLLHNTIPIVKSQTVLHSAGLMLQGMQGWIRQYERRIEKSPTSFLQNRLDQLKNMHTDLHAALTFGVKGANLICLAFPNNIYCAIMVFNAVDELKEKEKAELEVLNIKGLFAKAFPTCGIVNKAWITPVYNTEKKHVNTAKGLFNNYRDNAFLINQLFINEESASQDSSSFVLGVAAKNSNPNPDKQSNPNTVYMSANDYPKLFKPF